MLGKVFGTPETVRRIRVPMNEDDDLTSGESGEFRAGGKRITRPRSATASAGLQRSAKSDTNVRSSKTEAKKEAKTEPAPPPAGRSRARSFDSGSSKPQEQETGDTTTSLSSQNESRPTSIDLNTNSAPTNKRQLEKRLSDSQLEADRERRKSRGTPTSPQGGQQTNTDTHRDKGRARDVSKSAGGSRTSANQATSPGGGSSVGNKQKKRPTKALPTPRPVSAKPSAVLKRLAEQKKEEEAELEATAVQQSQTDGTQTSGTDVAATKEDTVETNHLQNGTIKGEPSGSSKTETTETVLSNKQSPSKIEESPSKKKTLPVCYNNIILNKVHI